MFVRNKYVNIVVDIWESTENVIGTWLVYKHLNSVEAHVVSIITAATNGSRKKSAIEMGCAICYHLYNLKNKKNVKNIHGDVLLLVQLY